MSKKKTTDEMTVETATEKTAVVHEPTFTKAQIINSKRFRKFKYILAACLEDDKKYTINEIEKIIKGVK